MLQFRISKLGVSLLCWKDPGKRGLDSGAVGFKSPIAESKNEVLVPNLRDLYGGDTHSQDNFQTTGELFSQKWRH